MGLVTGSLPVLPSQAEMLAICYAPVATIWLRATKKLAIWCFFGYLLLSCRRALCDVTE